MIKGFEEGEYKFGTEVYVVDHFEGTIKITKGDAWIRTSWDTVEDMMADGKLRGNKDDHNYLYDHFCRVDELEAAVKWKARQLCVRRRDIKLG